MMTLDRLIRGLGQIVLYGWGLSACAGEGGTDGQTHFLQSCLNDADCPNALSCECGVCTLPCTDSGQCIELGANARCGMRSCESSSTSTGICTLRCTSDDQCSERSSDLSCLEQRCTTSLQSVEQSLGQSAPTELGLDAPAGDLDTPEDDTVSCSTTSPCLTIDCPFGSDPTPTLGDAACCTCEFTPACTGGAPAVINARATAARLSEALFRQPADSALETQADFAGLSDAQAVGCFARELLSDGRAAQGIEAFMESWLQVTTGDTTGLELTESSLEQVQAVRQDTLRFASTSILQGEGLLETLLLDPTVFVNQHNATLYGVTAETDQLNPVVSGVGNRPGLFTRTFFLANTGVRIIGNVVSRGFHLRERLMCDLIPQPPAGVPELEPESSALTAREQLEAHTESPACAGCHSLFDPFGYSFEHFDGAGRWQTLDGDILIDTSTTVVGTTDIDGTYQDVTELMEVLARSHDVQSCISEQWLRYLYSDTLTGATLQAEAERLLSRGTLESGFSLREMIVGSVESSLFLSP